VKIRRWEDVRTLPRQRKRFRSRTQRLPAVSWQGQIRYQQGFFSVARTWHHLRGHGSIITTHVRLRGETRGARTELNVKVPPAWKKAPASATREG